MPPAPGSPAPGPSAPDRRRTPSTPATAGVLGVLVGGAALLVTLAALVAWLSPATLGERPATCLTTSGARCFCEAVGTGLLRQPANSLSSLGFCVAAATTAARGRRLGRHTPERVLAPVVALTLVALGAGSLAYHAQLTFAGQVLDVQGMYLLGTLLVVGALWRRGALDATRAAAWAAALLLTLLLAQAILPDARRWLFALVLLPGIVLEWRLAPALAPSPSRCSPSASRMPRGWPTIGVCGVSRAPGCRATPSGICSPRLQAGCSSPTTAEPCQDTKTPPAPMPGAKRNCRELWVRPDVP